ncbi:helix-turn-helix domain-containing protein [Adhaeribacter rhizoryzae]|uniref:Helix-turn-helix domain-containing protein n=1 Tax=Adhaeribacter rhizoryzae TaxID=2607907 RepID=A0A5M6DNX4_9BACT|nr:helix-turn-helix domain-containing protein [Adhaeribacter rhizoryzae]KAA5548126.1 helix-turn-helix domain-containing protein [Adhaeribacter rhizoryzae]
MQVELITKEDLQAFRLQLVNELKELLRSHQPTTPEWLRSSEVRKKLKISASTLQNYRISGKLTASKVGSIHFYRSMEVERLLDNNR